ncbi:MAG: YbaB/EbfC family nucleoid-associated protein [Longicatena sp.]
MNMQALLKQAQKMQKELADVEKNLAAKTYEASNGGGVVKVEVNGNMNINSISIDEALLDKENKEDLEEMLKSTLNEALTKANKDKEETMNSVTGGVKMPGGF